MAVGKSCATGGGRIRGGRVLRRCRGRNGGGFVVLRGQSPIVNFVFSSMGFGRTFDVHERHRARHRALARLLLGAPRQQFDTLDAAIPATKTPESYSETIQERDQKQKFNPPFYCFHAPLPLPLKRLRHYTNFRVLQISGSYKSEIFRVWTTPA